MAGGFTAGFDSTLAGEDESSGDALDSAKPPAKATAPNPKSISSSRMF